MPTPVLPTPKVLSSFLLHSFLLRRQAPSNRSVCISARECVAGNTGKKFINISAAVAQSWVTRLRFRSRGKNVFVYFTTASRPTLWSSQLSAADTRSSHPHPPPPTPVKCLNPKISQLSLHSYLVRKLKQRLC